MTLKPTLMKVAALSAVVFLSACGNPSRESLSDAPVLGTGVQDATVSITSGQIAGYVDDGIFIYKGIPYAKAERFSPAVDPDPWEGVRPCRAFGPTCPQGERTGWYDDNQAFSMHWDDGFPDEDCLRVNVWTPTTDKGSRKPVLVWLHGGGFHSGSGQELISYDGTSLAKRHDVVVVTLNHRLNVLGHLDLSDFGEEFKGSGNLGMTDIVKALQWVRDNITSFGGDPSNVTIFGQSGGGGKVTTLMAMPSAKGLFHKALVESGSIVRLMENKYSRMLGAYTVEELGLNQKTISKIREVPYEQLLSACRKATSRVSEAARADGVMSDNFLLMILFGTEPVVDGETIPYQPGSPEAIAISSDIPLMVGTTREEFGAGTPDNMFLPLAKEHVQARTAASAPTYMYLFDWDSPVLDGALGCTHCLDIPFFFDNVELHKTMTGGSPKAIELGHRISTLLTSFAKTGTPSAEGMPQWMPYTEDGKERLLLDYESKMESIE